MNRPDQYELKKWLCQNTVKGLVIHYYQTGNETSDTDWEMIPIQGEPLRVKSHSVIGLVELRPDWVRVLYPHARVRKEVEDYDKFAKNNAAELATYKRLKAKFEGAQ